MPRNLEPRSQKPKFQELLSLGARINTVKEPETKMPGNLEPRSQKPKFQEYAKKS